MSGPPNPVNPQSEEREGREEEGGGGWWREAEGGRGRRREEEGADKTVASFTLSKDFLWHILITLCNPPESLSGGFMLLALLGNRGGR